MVQKRPDGTKECSSSSSLIPAWWATLENDWMGRQAVIRPHPGSGQMDCPVAKTGMAGRLPDFTVKV